MTTYWYKRKVGPCYSENIDQENHSVMQSQGCHGSGKSKKISGQEKATLVRKIRENCQKSGKTQTFLLKFNGFCSFINIYSSKFSSFATLSIISLSNFWAILTCVEMTFKKKKKLLNY